MNKTAILHDSARWLDEYAQLLHDSMTVDGKWSFDDDGDVEAKADHDVMTALARHLRDMALADDAWHTDPADLPDADIEVLIYVDGDYHVAHYVGEDLGWASTEHLGFWPTITAWRHLPESP